MASAGIPASPRLDRLELRHYLFQKYTSPGGTIIEGVESLPPATVLEVGPDRSRTYRYWDPPDGRQPRDRPDDEASPAGDDEAVAAAEGSG